MSFDRTPAGRRRRRWGRRAENALYITMASLGGIFVIVLWVAITVLPWIVLAFVLHWLGAF